MFPVWSPAENAAMQQIAQLQLLIQDLQGRLLFAESQHWPQQQEIQRLQGELQRRDDQIKHLQEQLQEATSDLKTMRKEFDLLKAQVFKLKKAVDVSSLPQQKPQAHQRQPSQNHPQYLEVPQQQTNRKPSTQVSEDQPRQKARQSQQQQPAELRSQSEQQLGRSYSEYNTSHSNRQQPGPQRSRQTSHTSDRGYNDNDTFNSNRQQPPDQHRAQKSDQQSARGHGTSNGSHINRQQQSNQQHSQQTSQPSNGGYSNSGAFESNGQQQPAQQRSQQTSQHSARGYSHGRNASYSNLNTSAVPSKLAITQSSAREYAQSDTSSSNRQQQTIQPSAGGYGSNTSKSIRHDSALPAKQVSTQSSARAQCRAGSGRYPYDSAMPTDYGQHGHDNGTHNSSIMPYGYTRPLIRANTETSAGSTRPETSDPKQQPPKLSSKKNTGRLQPGEQFSMSSFEAELCNLSFDSGTRAVTGSVGDPGSKDPVRESEDDPFVDSPPNKVAGYGKEPGSIRLSPVPLPPGLMSLEETMQMIESEETEKAEILMVKYETRDDRLATTAAEIDRICQMIARWSASICSKNGDIDLQLHGVTTTDVSRLALIVESLAPLPSNEAKEYALELLRSRYTSQLLATIVWRFLQQRMMQPDILTGLLPNTFEKVVLNQQQLMQTRDTDTSPEERARMIRERGDAVNEILQHREFIAFRVSKVKEVITELRPIVKPFFGAKGVKTAAALELNDIGMKVFDLLINTLTESGVFVTKWANIRQGYLPSAMRAPFNREPPSALWGKRVQLSIFPSITFRNDSAGNIYTKMTNSAVVVLGKGDLFAAKQ